MILEAAIFDVKTGREPEFEKAIRQARPLISASPGFISVEVRKCVGAKNRYLLLGEWQKLEDHTVGFRQSARYQEWRSLLHNFYDPFPIVEHYTDPLDLGIVDISRQ